MNSRERFEVKAKEWGYALSKEPLNSGREQWYWELRTESAWVIWQAALSAAPTPPEVEPVGKVVERFNIDRLYDGLEVEFTDAGYENVNAGDLVYTSPPAKANRG